MGVGAPLGALALPVGLPCLKRTEEKEEGGGTRNQRGVSDSVLPLFSVHRTGARNRPCKDEWNTNNGRGIANETQASIAEAAGLPITKTNPLVQTIFMTSSALYPCYRQVCEV